MYVCVRRVNKKEIKCLQDSHYEFYVEFHERKWRIKRGIRENYDIDADDCRLNCGTKFDNDYSSIDLHNQKEPYSMAKRKENNKMQLFFFFFSV